MTPQETNRRIAQAMGWIVALTPQHLGIERAGKTEHNPIWRSYPDYCGDLNAMAEAEKQLNCLAERNSYLNELCNLNAVDYEWLQVTAPASLRAAAWLKAKGLNKEEQ